MKFSISWSELLGSKGVTFVIILLAGLLTFVWGRGEQQKQDNENPQMQDVSTFIPAGFVLVPIDIQNHASVDSILGPFGVVDLFAVPAHPNGQTIRLVSRVKILRAPLNPKQFAVLVPEDKAPRLVRHAGPLFVVIQNPKQKGTHFAKKQKKRRLIYVEKINDGENE